MLAELVVKCSMLVFHNYLVCFFSFFILIHFFCSAVYLFRHISCLCCISFAYNWDLINQNTVSLKYQCSAISFRPCLLVAGGEWLHQGEVILKADVGSHWTGMHQLVGKCQRKHLISALWTMFPRIFERVYGLLSYYHWWITLKTQHVLVALGRPATLK